MYAAKEVAAAYRVHMESVLRWIRAGEIEAEKDGRAYRISRTALKAFEASHPKYSGLIDLEKG